MIYSFIKCQYKHCEDDNVYLSRPDYCVSIHVYSMITSITQSPQSVSVSTSTLFLDIQNMQACDIYVRGVYNTMVFLPFMPRNILNTGVFLMPGSSENQ